LTKSRIPEWIARSELIVVGECGPVMSTGGSMNVEFEVQDILKGTVEDQRVMVAFYVMGMVSPPELRNGERYIFLLQRRQSEGAPFFGLMEDSPDSIIPFNAETATEIRRLVSAT
jgi:hypothetical protein